MKLKITTGPNACPTIWVHGEIGADYGGVSSSDVLEALKSVPNSSPIIVRVNSPGGSFRDSIAIHSMLSRREGDVHVVVDSEASSGGSIVAMAGDTISMHTGSWMMIHEPMANCQGARSSDMRVYAERLDAITNQLMGIYKTRWKGTDAELRQALADELEMCDADAVARGMADTVDSEMAVAARSDRAKSYRTISLEALKEELPPVPASIKANRAAFERLLINTHAENTK